MAATSEQRKAISNVLHAFVNNASSMTTESINQITQLISAPAPPASITNAQLEQYDGNPGGINRRRPENSKLSRKKADKTRNDRVNLRPLNAFICFRSYYSPIFTGLTQKIKSGLIRQLWTNDQWKHFWTIEAKAYSDVRDDHINKVSLNKFLIETVGLLGVIPANEYLPTMGWKLVLDGPTEYRLVKINPSSTMQNTPLSTNLSAADIVRHCYEIGLVERPVQPTRINAAASAIAMAFAANPHPPKIPISVQGAQTTGTFTDEHGLFDQMTAQTQVDIDAVDGDHTMTDNAADTVNDEASAPFGENLSIETATADVQRALEDYPDEYPFNHHFHPAVDQPILAFDPTVVQDDFDPFDIAEYLHVD